MHIEERGQKVIINGYEIMGWITVETCTKCGSNMLMNRRWDATFCPQCNEWKEKNCEDPDCTFCRSRPIKPLP